MPVAGKVTNVCNGLAQCLVLRLWPLKMTTGPEGPVAGSGEKVERPTLGALFQKCLCEKERDSRERMRGRNEAEGECQVTEPENPSR